MSVIATLKHLRRRVETLRGGTKQSMLIARGAHCQCLVVCKVKDARKVIHVLLSARIVRSCMSQPILLRNLISQRPIFSTRLIAREESRLTRNRPKLSLRVFCSRITHVAPVNVRKMDAAAQVTTPVLTPSLVQTLPPVTAPALHDMLTTTVTNTPTTN